MQLDLNQQPTASITTFALPSIRIEARRCCHVMLQIAAVYAARTIMAQTTCRRWSSLEERLGSHLESVPRTGRRNISVGSLTYPQAEG